jgi:carbamoyltransferase
MPVWVKEKLFMRTELWDELNKINGGSLEKRPPLLFPEHHLSHAASAFYPSPFDEAAILTIDGVGEWVTTAIGYGHHNQIEFMREIHYPHSIGLLYSAFTAWCGFRVNSGEYKLMGLAPYGNPMSERTKQYREAILEHLIDVREDGSFLLNLDYFDYATGLKMFNTKRWQRLFDMLPRDPEAPLTQPYMDMALAIQQVTESIVIQLAKTAQELTGSRNLVMAGGVALNCVANGKLINQGIIDQLWIQPAAGDAGGALGAAYAALHIHEGIPRNPHQNGSDLMQGSYLGPAFDKKDIHVLMNRYGAVAHPAEDIDLMYHQVAQLLADGQVVGWFQGRMEWGPRALGNRSILGDPRHPKMQKKLNLKIKYREGFRPFAPSVIIEECHRLFELSTSSPYMLLVAPVQDDIRQGLPDGYEQMELVERLYVLRSDLPAITHVDFSARIQTVHQETNPRYWKLISAFKELTGFGCIVNTSFNVRGEPIVCTPDDAYRCFMRTEMDYLVIGDYVFAKQDQPAWSEEKTADQLFEPD